MDGRCTYWLGEEYGPDLLHVGPQGKLIHIFHPGDGLPPWLKHRRVNMGFEASLARPIAFL